MSLNEEQLTDEQKEILNWILSDKWKQPIVIKGAAGSGKSEIAHLIVERLYNSQLIKPKIALVSFTNSIVKHLKKQFEGKENISVNTAHHTIEIFWEKVKKENAPNIGFNTFKDIWEKMGKNPDDPEKYFYEDEFKWILGNNIKTCEQYEEAPRTGRGKGSRLSKEKRQDIWKELEEYKKKSKEKLKQDNDNTPKDYFDFNDAPNACLDLISQGADPQLCDYLIIDEFQDLTKSMLEFLIKTCTNPNHIIFIGDLAQSIYKSSLSWKDVFTDEEGNKQQKIYKKTFELKQNFRNTHQIALAAQSLLAYEYEFHKHEYDKNDYTNMHISDRKGPKPIVAVCRDEAEQKGIIKNILKRGKIPQNESIIFLTRDRKHNSPIQGLIAEYKGKKYPNLEYSTLHSSKGLSYDNVFILDVNDDIIPRKSLVEKEGNDALPNERRLLFVGMTRARKRLFLISSGKPSRFLAEIEPKNITPIALDNEEYENLYEDYYDRVWEGSVILEAKIEDLEREIAKLRKQGENEKADRKNAELEQVRESYENVTNVLEQEPFNKKRAKIVFAGRAKIKNLHNELKDIIKKILKEKVPGLEYNKELKNKRDYEDCTDYDYFKNKSVRDKLTNKNISDIFVGVQTGHNLMEGNGKGISGFVKQLRKECRISENVNIKIKETNSSIGTTELKEFLTDSNYIKYKIEEYTERELRRKQTEQENNPQTD